MKVGVIEIGNDPYLERAFRGRAGVTATPKALNIAAMQCYGRIRQSDEVVVIVKLIADEDTAMYLRIKL